MVQSNNPGFNWSAHVKKTRFIRMKFNFVVVLAEEVDSIPSKGFNEKSCILDFIQAGLKKVKFKDAQYIMPGAQMMIKLHHMKSTSKKGADKKETH